MAIGWLAVLQSAPWAEVIRNAPKVADGAKKLWSTISRKPSLPKGAAADAPATLSPEARLAAVEATAADLHAQMLASSELIKALAEQNSELIRHAEASRLRLLWLTRATFLVGLVAVAALLLATGRA